MHFKGLLFDLDGTLVNSLDFVEESWRSWANSKGLDSEAVRRYLHGKPAMATLRHFMPGASDAALVHEFTLLEDFEACNTASITPVPGAVEFLLTLQRLAVPWGIVTSGSLKVASARIKRVGFPAPPVLVTSEDIQHGKPNPEPFLLGAGRLNLQAADCIAFEDSFAGLVSAQQAGCAVVEVLTTKTVPHDITPFLTVADYLGVSVAAACGYYFTLKC